eukprot:TRINITY_DN67214_c2_g1_i1.p1 TRINITY_DN67214_c2_g1~~TRINITY_DN67214_c2_g1_i1.p1  ORF type:complete len:215 (+),score=29.20 TRINITY_DN67214_c2_g1_i1:27-647(+)
MSFQDMHQKQSSGGQEVDVKKANDELLRQATQRARELEIGTQDSLVQVEKTGETIRSTSDSLDTAHGHVKSANITLTAVASPAKAMVKYPVSLIKGVFAPKKHKSHHAPTTSANTTTNTTSQQTTTQRTQPVATSSHPRTYGTTEEQEQQLDMLMESIKRTNESGKALNAALQKQEPELDALTEKMTNTTEYIKKTTKKTNRVAGK